MTFNTVDGDDVYAGMLNDNYVPTSEDIAIATGRFLDENAAQEVIDELDSVTRLQSLYEALSFPNANITRTLEEFGFEVQETDGEEIEEEEIEDEA